jgi:hypothetical protein
MAGKKTGPRYDHLAKRHTTVSLSLAVRKMVAQNRADPNQANLNVSGICDRALFGALLAEYTRVAEIEEYREFQEAFCRTFEEVTGRPLNPEDRPGKWIPIK